jgi:hypothetical protein
MYKKEDVPEGLYMRGVIVMLMMVAEVGGWTRKRSFTKRKMMCQRGYVHVRCYSDAADDEEVGWTRRRSAGLMGSVHVTS